MPWDQPSQQSWLGEECAVREVRTASEPLSGRSGRAPRLQRPPCLGCQVQGMLKARRCRRCVATPLASQPWARQGAAALDRSNARRQRLQALVSVQARPILTYSTRPGPVASGPPSSLESGPPPGLAPSTCCRMGGKACHSRGMSRWLQQQHHSHVLVDRKTLDPRR